ncbi:MAG: DUF389 domain-containing protein [Geminicoccaceae bacterium]
MSDKSDEGYLAHNWRRLAAELWSDIEALVPAADLSRQMRRLSAPSFAFFFMLAVAATIATLGLIANSAPAVIGAMIIAPLMAPIISLSYGLVTVDFRLMRRSLLTVVFGVVLVIAVGYISTISFGLRIAGSEILTRTSPSLIDFGVAMAAGAAAAFSYTRRSIATSIAGVAIAVALVPPLAVSGIGLALGAKAALEPGLSMAEFGLYGGGDDIAEGAFVLFLTNLIGIVAIAILVFVCQRYGEWKKALVTLFACIALSGLLLQPLNQAFHRMYVKSKAVRLITKLSESRPDIVSGEGRIESVSVNYRNGVLHVAIDGFTSRKHLGGLQRDADQFRRFLSKEIGEPVVVDLDAIGVDIVHVRSQPPAKPNEEN